MKTLLIEVLVLVVVGALSIIEGIRLVLAEKLQMYDVLGPGYYNVGMGAILILMGLVYFVSQRKKYVIAEKKSADRDPVKDKEYKRMMVGMIVVMIAYIFLLDLIGYLFSSFVFFLLINRIAGFRSWRTNLGVTVLMTVSYYLIFVTWLGMIFPRGLLFDF
jgi:putative tricarboxylic transport membrane protein